MKPKREEVTARDLLDLLGDDREGTINLDDPRAVRAAIREATDAEDPTDR